MKLQLRFGAWVLGSTIVLAATLNAREALSLWPWARLIAQAAVVTIGAVFTHCATGYANTLGRRRALAILILANPLSWGMIWLLVIGLLSLSEKPDAMNLNLAIGTFALLWVAVYVLWLAGMAWVFKQQSLWLALLYGGAWALAVPPFVPIPPLWLLLLGLGLMVWAGLSRPRCGQEPGSQRA